MASLIENNSLLALLVIILSHNVKPDLIVKPKDAEAVVGDSTFFNCSTSLPSAEIHWFHYAVGATQDRSFVYGYDQFYSPYQGRFQMEKNDATGVYNLVISSVTTDDAGRYECQDDVGRGDKDSGELTVLDGNPVCQSNMKPEGLIGPNICGLEPEELHLSCSVLYRGNQPPFMQWKEVGTESPFDGVTQNVSNNRVIFYLTMKVNFRMDGSTYQCQTTRSATSQYFCTSALVKVRGFNRVSFIVICVFVGLIIVIISSLVGFFFGRNQLRRTESKRNPQLQSTSKELEQMELISKQEPKKNSHPQSASKELEQTKLIQKQNKEDTERLVKENERLIAKVKELEQLIYSADNKSYRTASKLVHTIRTKAAETENAPITGIAILDNNLFVVSKNYPDIEVYDSKTFVFERVIENMPMKSPLDIASSKEDKCLYIISRSDNESASEIMKHTVGELGGKCWVTENDNGRLSTHESNLIACFSTKRIILEFSPVGKIENTVRLSPSAGFNSLWQAIKLTETKFAVSHSKLDDWQRVCVVDISGSVLMQFEELPRFSTFTREMNVPICLVEYCDKSLLVADTRNNRVLLLSSNLKFGGLLAETGGKQIPIRLCLNETLDRVFVGVISGKHEPETWKDGRILIYNARE